MKKIKKLMKFSLPLLFIFSCSNTEIKYPKLNKAILMQNASKYENGEIIIDKDTDYSKILNLKELIPTINKYKYNGELKIPDTLKMTLNIDYKKGKSSHITINNLYKSSTIYISFNNIGENETVNKLIEFLIIKDTGNKLNLILDKNITLDNTKFIIIEKEIFIEGIKYISYSLKPLFLTEKTFKEKRGNE